MTRRSNDALLGLAGSAYSFSEKLWGPAREPRLDDLASARFADVAKRRGIVFGLVEHLSVEIKPPALVPGAPPWLHVYTARVSEVLP